MEDSKKNQRMFKGRFTRAEMLILQDALNVYKFDLMVSAEDPDSETPDIKGVKLMQARISSAMGPEKPAPMKQATIGEVIKEALDNQGNDHKYSHTGGGPKLG